jgi:hypothetical protein
MVRTRSGGRPGAAASRKGVTRAQGSRLAPGRSIWLVMSATFDLGSKPGDALVGPSGLGHPAPSPPRKGVSRVVVAATLAVLLIIVGGLGWFLFLREPDPVRFRLALSEGDSFIYRVESTSEIFADEKLLGFDREISTQMDGMLKVDVNEEARGGFKGRADLSIFSFVVNGSVFPEPQRISRPVRMTRNGEMVGAVFASKVGLPILLFPAMSPLLPGEMMRPGDEIEVAGHTLFKEKNFMRGTTRFVGYEEVDGAQLAVLEGVLTSPIKGHIIKGTGEMQIDIRARIDPSTGIVHDAEGAMFGEVVIRGPGNLLKTTETFRIVPF